ncbi:MAG: glycosyltransferase [Gammaproteobacteria bacterium]|nr:glycosyltransferase [Gammaproteobacteria bacterium]
MNNRPSVSILLPFHNAATTLEECLDSIQAQTLTHYELLAVDDRSADESIAIMKHYASTDRRIRTLNNQGQGLVSALNTGLKASAAHLIARMDADDRMHPQRLARQFSHLQSRPGLTLLGCCAKPFPEECISTGFQEYMNWQNGCLSADHIAEEIYVESPFAHPTVMFRKETVVQLGGYSEGEFPEDYELWLRFHQAGYAMEKLPDRLLEWRDYPERTSRTDPRCSRVAFDRLRARFLAQDPRLTNRRDDFVIWGAGRKTRLRCRLLLEKGFQPSAWIDIDPKKIGNIINGVPVVAPDWLVQGVRKFVLVYVANHGAKDIIANDLKSMNYQRGRDYLMVG